MSRSVHRVAVVVVSSAGGYDGRTRALVNLARGLHDLGTELRLVLVDGVEPDLLSIDSELVVPTSRRHLGNWLRRFCPDLVVVDDDLTALRTLRSIREAVDAPLIIYALILFGMSAILHQHRERGASQAFSLRRAGSFLPVPLLTQFYGRRLQTASGVVAVSETAAKMLRWVYGVDVSGVAYPPIAVEDYMWSAAGEPREVLVYLGSHPTDTDAQLVSNLTGALLDHHASVTVFGNRKRSHQLEVTFPGAVTALHHCPVAALVDAYRRAEVVVCPQHWELFGYVPVEAALVGVPSVNLLGAGSEDVLRDIPQVRFALCGDDLIAHSVALLSDVPRVDREWALHLGQAVSPERSARAVLASV